MKKAVYKITNKINGKIYIGISNNPKRRWQEHISCGSIGSYSLIHTAIKKYGVKNFTFEIIDWFEDYEEKEKYYIEYYRSLVPYGYNISAGGNDPPHLKGEENHFSVITEELARKIQEQAMNWNIPRKQIVKNNKITFDIFRHINDGSAWHRDDLTYPLRPNETVLNEFKVDKVIELLKDTKLSQKDIAKQVGWSRSAITMINIGKNHYREGLEYPIRK